MKRSKSAIARSKAEAHAKAEAREAKAVHDAPWKAAQAITDAPGRYRLDAVRVTQTDLQATDSKIAVFVKLPGTPGTDPRYAPGLRTPTGEDALPQDAPPIARANAFPRLETMRASDPSPVFTRIALSTLEKLLNSAKGAGAMSIDFYMHQTNTDASWRPFVAKVTKEGNASRAEAEYTVAPIHREPPEQGEDF